MTFSIIMPSWNRAAVIADAIKSVTGQSFTDYELIIVDDGSEDSLHEVVKPYLSDKITYHRIEHRGVSAARNYGIQQAKGAYIAYLDSDNLWHSDYLERMHQVLSSEEGHETAYCKCNIFKLDKSGAPYLHRVLGRAFDHESLSRFNYIDLNTFVHSRHCVQAAGMHDEALRRMTDWDFILRVTRLYAPVYVPEVLVDYRVGFCSNSITYNVSPLKQYFTIRSKQSNLTRRVRQMHDAIVYTWDKLSPVKRENWLTMRRQVSDLEGFSVPGYPYMLQLEPTNKCNLACPLCPVGRSELKREPRHMALKEFCSLVDDMEQYLMFLSLWDWGEPLMNPELPAMVRYAAERDIRTVTSTNAHFLKDDDYVAELLSAGLSTLIVAVDSVCGDNYQAYRKDGNVSRVLSGVENAVAIKRKIGASTTINLRMVLMRNNENEIDNTRAFARSVGADVFTVKTINPSCGGLRLDAEYVPLDPDKRRYVYSGDTWERERVDDPCKRIWTMSNIFAGGEVVPCCYDYTASLNLGNINEKPFTEIWMSREYRDLREHIYKNKKSIDICNDCVCSYDESDTGWFYEKTDLRPAPGLSLWDRAVNRLVAPQMLRKYRKAGRIAGLR